MLLTRAKNSGANIGMPGKRRFLPVQSESPSAKMPGSNRYLIGDHGDSLSLEATVYNAYALTKKYPDDITAIVLMGGTTNNGITEKSLNTLIKALAKKTGLPIGLYSGRDEDPDKYLETEELKWVKTGSYKKALGGLEEPTTNQRFYVKEHTIVTDHYGVYSGRIPHWVDMTKQFQILKGEESAQQPNS